MQQNASPVDPAQPRAQIARSDMQSDASPVTQLRAQIARLEAELALYAFQYGLTHEARRLLDARLQSIGRFNL
ncbi:hypothetical protein EYC08_20915 [Tabrizicola sp. WMC-M-20]|nr:hypothetical protein EYC08_20915 [Tabrizicola sp. WMC-M-20]